jgi:hypothetical protein
MRRYDAYRFRGKEPVIDEVRTLVQNANGGERKITQKQLRAIENAGGPTVGCMTAWFFGKTQRPQSASIEAAGRALGYKRKWVRMTKE